MPNGRSFFREQRTQEQGRHQAYTQALQGEYGFDPNPGTKPPLETYNDATKELQGIIKEQADQMKALGAGRKKDQQQLNRILEEREEVRLRVDHLLEEIARIEASVEPGP